MTENIVKLSVSDLEVLELKRKHAEAHWGLGVLAWTGILLEEVFELLLALLGLHKDDPDWELAQIASIAMNWREARRSRK